MMTTKWQGNGWLIMAERAEMERGKVVGRSRQQGRSYRRWQHHNGSQAKQGATMVEVGPGESHVVGKIATSVSIQL